MSVENAPNTSSPTEGGSPVSTQIPGMALPRTIYVWLVLLIVAFGISETQGRLASQASGDKGAILTDTDFRAVLMADVAARQYFAIEKFSAEPQSALLPEMRLKLETQKRDALEKAITEFRRLGAKGKNPKTPRKILILEHAAGKPLDTAFLQIELVSDLKAQKTIEAEIQEEIRFWTRLYGARSKIDKSTLTADVKRVGDMGLGYMTNKALADLYRAAGDTPNAERYETLLYNESQSVLSRQLTVTLISLVFLLTGVVVLLVFNANVVRHRWDKVGADAEKFPEDSRPQRIGFGALADVFIAYLTILQLARLVVELVATNFLPEPNRATIVGLTAGAYVLPSLLATFYLAMTLRRYNVSWSTIGLSLEGRPLGAQLWYGFLGYCAALPLIALLGMVAQRIFQNNPNATPNPILPLASSEPDPIGRLVIFLLASLAAPIFEELFFRGVLLTGLRARYSFIPSLLLSAVLFAVVHPTQDWLPILALGTTLGALRLLRNSLIPGITAHAFQNAMTFFTISALVGN